jgi:hypothetical protein
VTVDIASMQAKEYNDLIRYDSSTGIVYLNPSSLKPAIYSFLITLKNGNGASTAYVLNIKVKSHNNENSNNGTIEHNKPTPTSTPPVFSNSSDNFKSV